MTMLQQEKLIISDSAITPQKQKEQLKKYYTETCFRLTSSFAPENENVSIEDAPSNLVLCQEEKENLQQQEKEATQKQETSKGIDIQSHQSSVQEEHLAQVPKDQIALLHARKQQVKIPIALSDLFKPREVEDRRRDINSVSINASAGMGKTTLVQKFAYEWAQGKHPDFEFVYVLKVRNLTKETHGAPPKNDPYFLFLAKVIARECFPQSEDSTEEFNSLVRGIAEQLKHKSTVVILDGLDELNRQDKTTEHIVDQVQKGSHKRMVTSRSYGLEHLKNQVDLEVDLLGLDKDQVAAYVHKYLQDPEQAKALLEFLEKHPSFGAMVQVPVTLNMFCALWAQNPKKLQNLSSSRSGLYKALTEYLWNRYDEKHEHQEYQNKERDSLFKTLGQIALSGMKKGEALISPKTMEGVLNSVEANKDAKNMMQGTGLLEKENMTYGHFLDTVGSAYVFPHLTFQEYFAGQELARQLCSKDRKDRKSAADFIAEHKYEKRFEVMLRFTAGAVYQEEGLKGAKALLRALDSDREVMGLQHTLLQLRCLNEWLEMGMSGKDYDALEKEFGLVKTLNDWIKQGWKQYKKGKHTFHNTLVRAFPDLGKVLGKSNAMEIYSKAAKDKYSGANEILIEVVKASPELAKSAFPFLNNLLIEHALFSLKMSARRAGARNCGKVVEAFPMVAEDIISRLMEGLKYKHEGIRSGAVEALGEVIKVHPQQAKEVIPFLKKALKDDNYHVRMATVEVFGEVVKACPELAEDVISRIVEALKDRHEDVRKVATKAFGKVVEASPEITEKTISFLKIALENEYPYAREAAIKALSEVVEASRKVTGEVIPFLKKTLKDDDYAVRRAAIDTLCEAIKADPKQAKEVMPLLENALEDRNEYVRKDAIYTLCEVVEADPQQAKEVILLLENALKDRNEYVCRAAIYTLCEVVKVDSQQAKEVILLLENALEDRHEYVRRQAIDKLCEVIKVDPKQAKEVTLLLKNALKDRCDSVRRAAIDTLCEVIEVDPQQVKAVILLFENALKDESVYVRRDAVYALGRVVKAHPKQVKEVMPLFKKALKDEDKDIRKAVVEILGKAIKGSPDRANAVLPFLKKALDKQQKSFRVRSAAIYALGEVVKADSGQAEELIPLLKNALNSESEYVCEAAIYTLGRVVKADSKHAKEVKPLFKKALKFNKVLKNKDKCVRKATARALVGVIIVHPQLTEEMKPLLKKALDDLHKCVREVTASALVEVVEADPQRAKEVKPLLKKALKDIGLTINDRDCLVYDYRDTYSVIKVTVKALAEVAKAHPQQLEELMPLLKMAQGNIYWDVRKPMEKFLRGIPTKMLIEAYLSGDHCKNLLPVIKNKLYRETLTIRSLEDGSYELTLYSSDGQREQWTVPKEQKKRVKALQKLYSNSNVLLRVKGAGKKLAAAFKGRKKVEGREVTHTMFEYLKENVEGKADKAELEALKKQIEEIEEKIKKDISKFQKDFTALDTPQARAKNKTQQELDKLLTTESAKESGKLLVDTLNQLYIVGMILQTDYFEAVGKKGKAASSVFTLVSKLLPLGGNYVELLSNLIKSPSKNATKKAFKNFISIAGSPEEMHQISREILLGLVNALKLEGVEPEAIGLARIENNIKFLKDFMMSGKLEKLNPPVKDRKELISMLVHVAQKGGLEGYKSQNNKSVLTHTQQQTLSTSSSRSNTNREQPGFREPKDEMEHRTKNDVNNWLNDTYEFIFTGVVIDVEKKTDLKRNLRLALVDKALRIPAFRDAFLSRDKAKRCLVRQALRTEVQEAATLLAKDTNADTEEVASTIATNLVTAIAPTRKEKETTVGKKRSVNL